MKRLKHLQVTMFSTILLTHLQADLIAFPDDLISERGEIKYELGFNYANSTNFICDYGVGYAFLDHIFNQGPISNTCVRSNYDAISLTPGFRYGITNKTELYTKMSFKAISSQGKDIFYDKDTSDSYSKFNDIWVGVNHRVWDEGKTPGLILFLETAAIENTSLGSSFDNVYAKTWVAGGTIYKTLDPVVLALTASYRHTLPRNVKDLNDLEFTPGNSIVLNPSISFSLNNEVSLTGGFQWQFQEGFKTNIVSGKSSTRTDLNLGVGYMWDRDISFHLSTSFDMTGDGGSNVIAYGSYALGKQPKDTLEDKKEKNTPPEHKNSSSPVSLASKLKEPSEPISPNKSVTKVSDESKKITMLNQKINGNKLLLRCQEISVGWNEKIFECEPIEDNLSSHKKAEILSFDDELNAGISWLKSQNPNHYTVEVSVLNVAQTKLLLENLNKTRVTFKNLESHVHPLKHNQLAVAVGVFETRDEAALFLETLDFLPNKSTDLLRTFGGLSKEIRH